MSNRPVLWHITISHFSEKVRWALDHKAIAHVRRAPPPGLHMAIAGWLTGARSITLPILELDGRRIVDSSAILAALERRCPAPALYPSDPAERRRALELEDWFDEQLGPYTRRLAFYELRRDRELLAQVSAQAAPAMAAGLGRALVPYSRLFTGLRYRAAGEEQAREARARIVAALEHLESELGGREYLIGGRFTVADLTAAALLFPIARPPQAPSVIGRMPAPYERFRESLSERPGYRWVLDIYRRHRLPARTGPREADLRGAQHATGPAVVGAV